MLAKNENQRWRRAEGRKRQLSAAVGSCGQSEYLDLKQFQTRSRKGTRARRRTAVATPIKMEL